MSTQVGHLPKKDLCIIVHSIQVKAYSSSGSQISIDNRIND